MLRLCRFLVLVLAALALTMTSAHVLELPQKLVYDPEMYAAVNSSLYRFFAIVGSSYMIGAILIGGVLSVLVRRRRPSFAWTLAGEIGLVLALVSWVLIVSPVNATVSRVLATTPDALAQTWSAHRDRWEHGHVIGFVIQVAAFSALVMSVLVECPDRDPARRHADHAHDQVAPEAPATSTFAGPLDIVQSQHPLLGSRSGPSDPGGASA